MTDAPKLETDTDGPTPGRFAELDELAELAAYLGRSTAMRVHSITGDRRVPSGLVPHLLNADSFIL